MLISIVSLILVFFPAAAQSLPSLPLEESPGDYDARKLDINVSIGPRGNVESESDKRKRAAMVLAMNDALSGRSIRIEESDSHYSPYSVIIDSGFQLSEGRRHWLRVYFTGVPALRVWHPWVYGRGQPNQELQLKGLFRYSYHSRPVTTEYPTAYPKESENELRAAFRRLIEKARRGETDNDPGESISLTAWLDKAASETFVVFDYDESISWKDYGGRWRENREAIEAAILGKLPEFYHAGDFGDFVLEDKQCRVGVELERSEGQWLYMTQNRSRRYRAIKLQTTLRVIHPFTKKVLWQRKFNFEPREVVVGTGYDFISTSFLGIYQEISRKVNSKKLLRACRESMSAATNNRQKD